MLKNAILISVILLLVGGVAYFLMRGDPESRPPDTPESVTEWMCQDCRDQLKFTASQFDKLIQEPGRLDPNAPFKRFVLKCDKCNGYTVVRAAVCEEHHEWYIPRDTHGRVGMCSQCKKIWGGG